ncbi:hypothetical protein ACV07N_15695 [Roseivirga echinicomitans]
MENGLKKHNPFKTFISENCPASGRFKKVDKILQAFASLFLPLLRALLPFYIKPNGRFYIVLQR